MSNDTLKRRPGEALPGKFVRGLRERAGLTQDELAEQLGLAGKAVISGWETGRTVCEGPAAELLLRIVGGADASRAFAEIDELTESTWRRAKTWGDIWRQVTAVPSAPIVVERKRFVTLFPGAEIPPEGHVHGFPFLDHGLPRGVFGISANGWSGSIPFERDLSPRYVWHLTRNAEFSYREVPWELARGSVTGGHTHVGSLLEIALCTTVFLGRLAERAHLDRDLEYQLRLDLEGMQDRGIFAAVDQLSRICTDRHFAGSQETPRAVEVDQLSRICTDRHVHAMVSLPLGKIVDEPKVSAFALVGELMLLMAPDLATNDCLEKQLQVRIRSDAGNQVRFLAFAEGLAR